MVGVAMKADLIWAILLTMAFLAYVAWAWGWL